MNLKGKGEHFEMSYSVSSKCNECEKSDKCVDAEIIRGTVDSIHMIGSEKGHLGSGTITIDCFNHVVIPVKETIDE